MKTYQEAVEKVVRAQWHAYMDGDMFFDPNCDYVDMIAHIFERDPDEVHADVYQRFKAFLAEKEEA